MPLFMPTPPAKRTDIDNRPAGKQLTNSAHVECEKNACESRKNEADGCSLQLSEPDRESDPEFSATTPPSAVYVGYIEKENTHLDGETETKIRRNPLQRRRDTRLRWASDRATSSTKPETPGQESAHQDMSLHQF